MQVFVTNPRGWALSQGRADEDERFAQAATSMPAFVHASYLVNLASPDRATTRRSVQSLRHTVRRAAQVGARGVVVHTGSAVTKGRRRESLRQVRRLLLPVLDAVPDGCDVLLEPTAGQGESVCSTLDELAEYLDVLGAHERLGLCIDTCHAFAAGHDLTRRGGMKRFLDELSGLTTAAPLRLVHGNDCVDACGSGKDRHAAIGAGALGLPPFAALLRHPLMRGVPVVLETPDSQVPHAEQLDVLRSLRRRG